MRTITLLKNASKALEDILNYECVDFKTYENSIDFNAIRISLNSLKKVQSIYSENSVRRNAKCKLISKDINN